MKKNKYFWQLTIDSRNEARKIIAEVAWLFIGLGTYMIVLFLFLFEIIGIFDGAIYLFLGTLLGLKRYFWVTVVLLLLSGASIFSTAHNALNGEPGGRNVILSIVVFYAAVQSVLAVRYLKKKSGTENENILVTRSERWGASVFPLIFRISIFILISLFALFFFYPSI